MPSVPGKVNHCFLCSTLINIGFAQDTDCDHSSVRPSHIIRISNIFGRLRKKVGQELIIIVLFLIYLSISRYLTTQIISHQNIKEMCR